MWFVLLLLHAASSFSILEEVQLSTKDLASHAKEIVKNECAGCKTAMVIHCGQEKISDIFFTDSSDVSVYTIFVDGNDTEVKINDNGFPFFAPELTIIFFDIKEIETMEAIIFYLELIPHWNIRGKFLVLVDGLDLVEEELDTWLQESFESFWERQALRVLISIWQTDGCINSFTFDPYREIFKIPVTKNNRNDLWFNRKIKDMYGQPFKLYQFDMVLKESTVKTILPNGKETWLGQDGMFFSTMAEALNASLMVHPMSEDFSPEVIHDADPSLPFSQVVQVFIDMFDFDVLFNRMQTFADNMLDHIFLYERNDCRIVVPKSGVVPQYLYILMMVSGDVWAATLISLVAVIITRKLLGGKHAVPILDNFGFLLGTSAPHRPRLRFHEKFLLAIWMLGCVVLCTLFQTTLMSKLVTPTYYPNLDTIEDLLKTDLLVYGAEYTNIQISRIFLGDDDRFMSHVKNIPKIWTIYGTNIEWVNDYSQDYGIILSQDQVYQLQRTNRELFRTHHVMSESPMPNAQAYNMQTNKLYYEEMLNIFSIIQEAGLHLHWRDYDYYVQRDPTNSTRTFSSSSKDQTLALFHLQSAFMLLAFGLILSAFVFCCELAWHRNRVKRE